MQEVCAKHGAASLTYLRVTEQSGTDNEFLRRTHHGAVTV
jgi:hypothetical protein